LTVWAGGLDAKQAKTLCLCEWALTISPEVLESAGYTAYSDGVLAAEKMARNLAHVVNRYSEAALGSTIAGQSNIAVDRFWGRMTEQHTLLYDIARTGDAEPWEKALESVAKSVFDTICQPTSGKAWAAWAKVRGALKCYKPKEG
jgi:hypothetical protein